MNEKQNQNAAICTAKHNVAIHKVLNHGGLFTAVSSRNVQIEYKEIQV